MSMTKLTRYLIDFLKNTIDSSWWCMVRVKHKQCTRRCQNSRHINYISNCLSGSSRPIVDSTRTWISNMICWFRSSHCVTYNSSNLQCIKSCVGPNKFVVGNGHSLEVKLVRNTHFKSNPVSNSILQWTDLLHVPNITKYLILVSKFAEDNHVYFEFHHIKCFVKSNTSNQVLLEVFLYESGLYFFNNLTLESSRC